MGIYYQIKKKKLFFIFLVLATVFAAVNFVQGANTPPTGLDKAFDTGANMPLEAVAIQGAGYKPGITFNDIVGKVLTMLLGLMGVIFLVLGVYGGYNWMTAAGNEEKVSEAKKTITNALIGIIVVLAAYAITRFVVAAIAPLVFKTP